MVQYLGDLQTEAKYSLYGSFIYTVSLKYHDGMGKDFAPTDLLASGFWKNISDLNDLWKEDKSFNPNLKNDSKHIINLWEIRINKLLKVNE